MGLMIGASWLTIIEFIQYFISLCLHIAYRRRSRKPSDCVNPTNEKTDNSVGRENL